MALLSARRRRPGCATKRPQTATVTSWRRRRVPSASQAGRALPRSSGHSIVLLVADQSRTRVRSQGAIRRERRRLPDHVRPSARRRCDRVRPAPCSTCIGRAAGARANARWPTAWGKHLVLLLTRAARRRHPSLPKRFHTTPIMASKPYGRRSRFSPGALCSWAFSATERAGFEPAMEFDPHTRLAGECLQPLGHLSWRSGQFRGCPAVGEADLGLDCLAELAVSASIAFVV